MKDIGIIFRGRTGKEAQSILEWAKAIVENSEQYIGYIWKPEEGVEEFAMVAYKLVCYLSEINPEARTVRKTLRELETAVLDFCLSVPIG